MALAAQLRLPSLVLMAVILASACGRVEYEGLDTEDTDGGTPAESCRQPGCPGRCVPGGFGDEFEDTSAGNGWGTLVGPGGTAAEGGGTLTLQPGMDDEVIYQTVLFYPLDRMSAEVAVTIDDPAARSEVCLMGVDPVFDRFTVCQTESELRLHSGTGAAMSLPYDAAAHRYWRVRREREEVVFDTSPDGSTWTEIGRGETAVSTSVAIRLTANAWSLPTAGTTYTLDHLRIGTPRRTDGNAVGCAPSGLFDDFGDDDPEPLWSSLIQNGSIVMESSGNMVVAPPWDATAGGRSAARTIDLWDMEDGAVLVELDVTLSGDDSTCGIDMDGIDGTRAGFAINDGELFPRTAEGTVSAGMVPYEPAQHRWLRLREAAGTTHWEVSADGTAWTAIHSQPTAFYAPAVEVSLWATKYLGEAMGAARFDNLNLPP